MCVRSARRLFVISVMAMGVIASIAVRAVACDNNQGNTNACERVSREVTLSPDSATTYTVVGWLCQPKQPTGSIQLLNSGFTYDHNYWDWPQDSDRYSYVQAANKAGYATLNIDRIGVGESSKPPAADVTVPAEGWVDAQLAQALRKGQLSRKHAKFAHVFGVGHSLGGAIITVSQAQHSPFDAIVVDGLLHATNPTTVSTLGTIRYDASLDPKFAKAGLPTGYITSRPGTRTNYYTVQYAEQQVIALDEKLKATATTGEAATLALGRDPTYSQRITAPTMLWIGQQDTLHCDQNTAALSCANVQAILKREAAAWSGTSCLGVYVQPQSGHDTTLHRTAHLGASAVSIWLDQKGFGRHHSHQSNQQDYVLCA
jgi:pimeloyl-ACP methyl ester carboxylesterase